MRTGLALSILAVLLLVPVGVKAQQPSSSATKPDSRQGRQKQERHLSKPAKLNVKLGTVSVGTFYGSGPCWGFGYPCLAGLPLAPVYPYSYSLFYPSFYEPFYPPIYPEAFFRAGYPRGRVELAGAPKDAAVYIDGAYAGTAGKLKSFELRSGAYNLEVRARGFEAYRQRIYILSDRTLKIRAQMQPAPGGEKP